GDWWQGCRQRNPEMGGRGPPNRRARLECAGVNRQASPGDLRPRLYPGVVVHTVVPVVPAALWDRRLPELDLAVVRRRLVQVVVRAGALLDLVHVRARE